jgi:hypothetical protein
VLPLACRPIAYPYFQGLLGRQHIRSLGYFCALHFVHGYVIVAGRRKKNGSRHKRIGKWPRQDGVLI